jgi:uncharacterized membrane protein
MLIYWTIRLAATMFVYAVIAAVLLMAAAVYVAVLTVAAGGLSVWSAP